MRSRNCNDVSMLWMAFHMIERCCGFLRSIGLVMIGLALHEALRLCKISIFVQLMSNSICRATACWQFPVLVRFVHRLRWNSLCIGVMKSHRSREIVLCFWCALTKKARFDGDSE